MSLRKNLEYLRKQKKLSQEELAYKLGVSRQAVSKWESGAAYPEMEKILAMCKIFDCSLDELMNEDIQQLEVDKDRKYTFNDLVNEITEIVSRTFNMFDNMTPKSILRFGFEMFMLFLIILLLHIPFSYLFDLVNDVLLNIPGNISSFFISIWKLITEIVYIAVAVVSFVYVYKIRFLDKFESIKKEESGTEEKEEEIVKKEVTDSKERKVEVQRYDFGVFSFIGKIALSIIKGFTAFLSLPIIFLLFASVAGVLIGIVFMFNGVMISVGPIIFLLSLIIFAILLLHILYNFIVNHRTDWQKVFIFFVACIVGLGIGTGSFVLGFSQMEISNEAPEGVTRSVKEEIIEMKDDYVIENFPTNAQYIVDESLGNNLKIQVEYYDQFTSDVKVATYKDDPSSIYVYSENKQSVDLSELYSILINDLKEKRISNYTALGNIYIKVYGSEENINKLKENFDKRIDMMYQESITETETEM